MPGLTDVESAHSACNLQIFSKADMQQHNQISSRLVQEECNPSFLLNAKTGFNYSAESFYKSDGLHLAFSRL